MFTGDIQLKMICYSSDDISKSTVLDEHISVTMPTEDETTTAIAILDETYHTSTYIFISEFVICNFWILNFRIMTVVHRVITPILRLMTPLNRL